MGTNYHLQIQCFLTMGNDKSKAAKDRQDKNIKINHPRFQNCCYININEWEPSIAVTLPIPQKRQVEAWEKDLQSAPSSQSLLMPTHHQFKEEGFCGSSGFIKITYQNFPLILKDQIQNRRNSTDNKLFEPAEMGYLLYTMLLAVKGFHQRGMRLGDIRPENIFISQDGQVKIANRYTWPGEATNYEKTFYEHSVTYLPPQDLKDIQLGKVESSAPPESSEAFSIGLSCLQSAILQDSKQIYSNGKLNYKILENKLIKLRSLEPNVFYWIIESMCEVDAEKRSTCTQIHSWLYPYEDYLINLEDFTLNNYPPKILALRRRNERGFLNDNPQILPGATYQPQQQIERINYQKPYYPSEQGQPALRHPSYAPQFREVYQQDNRYAGPQNRKGVLSQVEHQNPNQGQRQMARVQFQSSVHRGETENRNFRGNEYKFNLNNIDKQLQESRKNN